MRQPAHRIAPHQHRRTCPARPKPGDPCERVEPLLGPAIGELIELHPVRSRHDDDERRERERQSRGDIKTSALGDDKLDREEETAREDGDGDELEEATARIAGIAQTRRVQRVDPAKEICDLQTDKEDEQSVDGEKGRCAGRRAQQAAKPRQEWGHRRVRPAPREQEEASGHPGEGRGDQDPADELADGPVPEVEEVGDRAREDGVRAREQKCEHEKERKGQRDPDADRGDAPSGPPRQRATEIRKRGQEERSARDDPTDDDEAKDDE